MQLRFRSNSMPHFYGIYDPNTYGQRYSIAACTSADQPFSDASANLPHSASGLGGQS